MKKINATKLIFFNFYEKNLRIWSSVFLLYFRFLQKKFIEESWDSRPGGRVLLGLYLQALVYCIICIFHRKNKQLFYTVLFCL